MNQLRRFAVGSGRVVRTAHENPWLPSTFFMAPKPFSTEASDPNPGSSDLQFLETPPTGLVYGKITNVTKHTTKNDIINLLEGCNLKPENLRVEYNRSYFPVSMMVEFSSQSAYDAAVRTIVRKGRLFNLLKAGRAQWEVITPYDGKAVLLQGIPRSALVDDVERFLSGCQYDSSSFQMIPRQTMGRPSKSALVRFPSQDLAMHAYVTKNRGFCLNDQINVQVLH